MKNQLRTLALIYDCISATLSVCVPISVLSRVSLAKVSFDEIEVNEATGMHIFSIKLPSRHAAKVYGALHALFEISRSERQLIAFSEGQWLVHYRLLDYFNNLDRSGTHSLPFAAIAMSQAVQPDEISSSFSLRLSGTFFARLGDAQLCLSDSLAVCNEAKEDRSNWYPLAMSDAGEAEEKLALIVGLASACSSYYEAIFSQA